MWPVLIEISYERMADRIMLSLFYTLSEDIYCCKTNSTPAVNQMLQIVCFLLNLMPNW